MFLKHRFDRTRTLVKIVGLLSLTLGTLTMVSACQSQNKTASEPQQTTSQSSDRSSTKQSTSKEAKTKAQTSSSAPAQASEETESDTTTSAPSVSSSSAKAQSRTPQVQITSGTQAVTYLKQQVGAQYPDTAEAQIIYGFIQETTVQNQKAYRVEIGKANGRSTIAVYNVLTDGQIIQVS